jgi:hypothetical protein
VSQPELLKAVVAFCEQAGIPYMVTGSLASSLQGEPRATHDIDVVVEIGPEHVPGFLAGFPPPRYYLGEPAMRDAIRRRSTFNLLDTVEGDKVDFWLLTDDPFDASRFARRQTVELFGRAVIVSAPEDTILMKLRWAELSGGSEKQFTDALRVYELQYDQLDHNYLEAWPARLQIDCLWARLKREAQTGL